MRWSRRRLVIQAMSSAGHASLQDMTDSTQDRTSVSDIGVAMFTVADQDAALAFYTQKLGFEVRADIRFGENDEMRWLEVAPPGSRARLALNPPMRDEPGGSAIVLRCPSFFAAATISAMLAFVPWSGGVAFTRARAASAAGDADITVRPNAAAALRRSIVRRLMSSSASSRQNSTSCSS